MQEQLPKSSVRGKAIPARTLAVLAIALWLVSAAAGLVEIYLSSEIVINLYVRFGGRGYAEAMLARQWVVFALAIVYLAFVIATGEYHRTRVGQKGSWRLFAWTFAIELLILILYFVV
jgi:hypothetical protein